MTKTTLATLDDRAKATATWYVVDASDQVLGRMAVRIAEILMGKHKPIYTPHLNVGDGIIVINAECVKVTGQKREDRVYRRYTGYMGGLKDETFAELVEKNPQRLITLAVRRMLPKNRLARDMLRRLKIYAGPEHPHQAQKPTPLSL